MNFPISIENAYIKMLQDITDLDLPRVGSKAANLGEMLKIGLPVPEGFVIVTGSYKKFVAENKINSEISNLLMELEQNNQVYLEQTAQKIKKLFEQAEIPPDLLMEIDSAYEKIGCPTVAVRSSATAEDLPQTSFAGQYDTYLNIEGKDQLHQSIKSCWASLWNMRALAYRMKQKADHRDLAHGVVIQKLIKAEKSGVLFTANPVNSRRDQMLLNSSWGLGEAIVGGIVTPDQWVLDKLNRTIIEEEIACKKVMTVKKEAGTANIDVPAGKREQATLNQDELFRLLELGEKAEKHFGSPQDIEWAFCDGTFYLVQSRPITSLFPMPEPKDHDQGLRVYVNFLMSNQAMPGPLTPLGEDAIRKAITGIIFNRKSRKKPAPWLKSAGRRVYADISEFHRFERWFDKLRGNPTDMDPVTTEAMVQVLEKNKKELSRQSKPLIMPALKMLFNINPQLLLFMITSIPKAIYGMVFPPEKVVAKAFEHGNKKIALLKKEALRLQTRQQKLDFIERRFIEFFYYVPLEIIYYVSVSFTYLEKAKLIILKHLGDASMMNKVKKAVPHNVTTEIGMELLRVAKELDQAGEKPSAAHPAVERFLTTYGHRSNQEVDLGVPRWKEDPVYIISVIQSYIDHKSFDEGLEKFNHDMEKAEQTIEKIHSVLKEKGANRDAEKVKKLLVKYRKMFGVRELPKYILTAAFALFRQTLLEIGEEMQAEGRLDHKDDIFYVTFADISSKEKLQNLVKQNREGYQRELQRVSVPRVITSTGEAIYTSVKDENSKGYKGIPVSPGIYEGPVKVLKNPEEGHRLKQGDILVATSTNPAWTPLFLVIGGLIMETGSPISHGSIVAREYGIPAIACVHDATTRFLDGQYIRINGETGNIEVLNKAGEKTAN